MKVRERIVAAADRHEQRFHAAVVGAIDRMVGEVVDEALEKLDGLGRPLPPKVKRAAAGSKPRSTAAPKAVARRKPRCGTCGGATHGRGTCPKKAAGDDTRKAAIASRAKEIAARPPRAPAPGAGGPGGRFRRCSACKETGHTAATCTAHNDDDALIRCDLCSARMMPKDAEGHAKRHGKDVSECFDGLEGPEADE